MGCWPTSWPMRPNFISVRFRTTLRLLLVGLCVVAHLATTIGFPVPTVCAPPNSSSRPFPCQDHHCGCHSADQCWRSCCCLSTREKLAWAREHGVTVPDDVLVAATEEAAADEIGLCCEHAEHSRHPQHRVAVCRSARNNGSCRARGKQSGCSECSQPTHAAPSGRAWLIGIHAQKCHGLSLFWIATGAIAPPPPIVELPADTDPAAWNATETSIRWRGPSHAPDVPPPRLSAVASPEWFADCMRTAQPG